MGITGMETVPFQLLLHLFYVMLHSRAQSSFASFRYHLGMTVILLVMGEACVLLKHT
jgi:hypothetical protein